MAQWLRNLTMLIVLIVWATVVITSLVRGVIPDAITWGVPGGVYFALNPSWPGRGNRDDANPPPADSPAVRGEPS